FEGPRKGSEGARVGDPAAPRAPEGSQGRGGLRLTEEQESPGADARPRDDPADDAGDLQLAPLLEGRAPEGVAGGAAAVGVDGGAALRDEQSRDDGRAGPEQPRAPAQERPGAPGGALLRRLLVESWSPHGPRAHFDGALLAASDLDAIHPGHVVGRA